MADQEAQAATILPVIVQEWTEGGHTIRRWLNQKIRIEASLQSISHPSPTPAGNVVLTVAINGKVETTIQLPWWCQADERIMLLQVFLLSQEPESPHVKVQPLLEKFCRMNPLFEEPTIVLRPAWMMD